MNFRPLEMSFFDFLANSRRRGVHALPACLLVIWLTSCAQLPTLPENKPKIYSQQQVLETQEGMASFYGGRWIGRLTANGERYRANDVTAAHKKLPFNSIVRVTNLRNGKTVIVRINNRGPYVKGRIIDLSVVAAKQIDMVSAGITKVSLEVLKEIPVVTKPNLKRKPDS